MSPAARNWVAAGIGATVTAVVLITAITIVIRLDQPEASAPAPVGPSALVSPDPGLTDDIAVSSNHSCAITELGTVNCWGDNTFGQLGDGTTEDRNTPVEAEGISNAISVTLSDDHSCALKADGTVSCWGRNDEGQSGLSEFDVLRPFEIPDLTNATALSAGEGTTCAVIDDGTVKCFGSNAHRRLGRAADFDADFTYIPETVEGIAGATAVAVLTHQVCAISSVGVDPGGVDSGVVLCWGDGTSTRSPFVDEQPRLQQVEGIDDAVRISGNGREACVLQRQATALCFVYDGNDGTNVVYDLQATNIETISTEGFGHCAITDEGIICGTLTVRNGITPVDGLTQAVAIATNANHTCVLLSNFDVLCWGQNQSGQLGDGSFEPATQPQPVVN